jgi:hypothetical protein
MCAVVDACCFASVFNPVAKEHIKWVPMYEWIMYGRGGKLVYGGSKYKKEVNFHSEKNKRLLLEIERKGRLVPMKDSEVDFLAASVKQKESDPDFDDEHLVALIGLSGCCVIATSDARADRFLKRTNLYPAGVRPPKIYRSARNKKLCGCEKHIAEICKER